MVRFISIGRDAFKMFDPRTPPVQGELVQSPARLQHQGYFTIRMMMTMSPTLPEMWPRWQPAAPKSPESNSTPPLPPNGPSILPLQHNIRSVSNRCYYYDIITVDLLERV